MVTSTDNAIPSKLATIFFANATVVLIGIAVFAFIGAIAVVHIISTQRKKEQLKRRHFIASFAHDIRTPLAVLLTNNEVALYDVQDAALQKVLHDNIEEIKNITEILNSRLLLNMYNPPKSPQNNTF
jgi:signal transduction histidine kinase